jgi:hypothetical protein
MTSDRPLVISKRKPRFETRKSMKRIKLWLWVPTETETKNDCADEGQQHSLDWIELVTMIMGLTPELRMTVLAKAISNFQNTDVGEKSEGHKGKKEIRKGTMWVKELFQCESERRMKRKKN